MELQKTKSMPELKPKVKALYDAVLELLNENADVNALTVADITKRAGIGKGTAYDYFSCKEEIIAGAIIYDARTQGEENWEYTYRNVVRSRLVCTLYSIASSVVGIVLSLSYRCRVRSRLCFYPAVTGTAYRLYDGCNGVVVCGIDDTVGRHNASFVDVDDSANDRRAFYPTLQDNTLGVGTSYRCRRCVGIVAGLFARRTFRCMYCFFTYCCLCGRALRIKGLSSLCS